MYRLILCGCTHSNAGTVFLLHIKLPTQIQLLVCGNFISVGSTA